MASYSISVMRNDGSSALFDFQQGKITIGQQRGEIATLDPMVADPHAELHFDGATLTYVDAGSPAGSFLPTGERLNAPLTLQPGASVRFGGCKLMIQDIRPGVGAGPSPAAPQPPVAPQNPVAPPPQAPVAQAAPYAPSPQGTPQAAPQAPYNPPGAAPEYGLPGAAPAQAPGAPLAQAGGAQVADPPPNAGVVDQFMHHVRVGLERYKKHYLNGILTIGLIAIPAALVNAALGWIPVVGFVVAILVGLAQLVIGPIAAGAMGRWALATAAGQDLHWKKAWKNALKDPVQEWLNMFVAQLITVIGVILLIVPGLIVGMFALPAYLLEDKKFVSINGRSAELVMKDPGGLLGLGFLAILSLLPLAFVGGIVVFIFALIPVVGAPMSAFLSVAINVIAAPFLYLLWAQIYYATIRRLEGHDPVATYAAKIQSWSTGE